MLQLSSGKLAVADAYQFTCEDAGILARRLSPGTYKTEVLLAEWPDGKRRAAAFVAWVREVAPDRWAHAPCEGQSEDELEDGEAFCMGGDSWIVCVADGDAVPTEFPERGLPFGIDEAIEGRDVVAVDAGAGRNVVGVRPGRGSGVYAMFWGEDAQGAACLVIDFDVVELGVEV